ncbi:hypothetical protein V6N13_057285 [Hibiscus sabdariffa]
MEPFPSSAFKVLIRIFTTTTKIYTDGCSARAHALGFTATTARSYSSGLGPCPDGQTGRMGSPQADARSTLVPKYVETACARFHDRGDNVSMGIPKARAWAATMIHVGPHPEPIGGSPAPIRFPPDNSKHSLTLFSKSFSSFPCSTCSLSVSRPYLALDEIYRPIRAAFPNNPTRRQRLVVRQGPSTTGLSPSPGPLSRGLGSVRR